MIRLEWETRRKITELIGENQTTQWTHIRTHWDKEKEMSVMILVHIESTDLKQKLAAKTKELTFRYRFHWTFHWAQFSLLFLPKTTEEMLLFFSSFCSFRFVAKRYVIELAHTAQHADENVIDSRIFFTFVSEVWTTLFRSYSKIASDESSLI